MSWTLTKQIVAMALMVFMGYVATKKQVINGEQSKIISRTLIYIITPCSLINAFQTQFDVRKLEGLVVATVIAAVAHGIFIGVAFLLGRGKQGLTPGEQAAAVYSNSGNLIIPLVAGTLGDEYIIYTCSFHIIQNLLFWTHVQASMGGDRDLTVKKVVTNPRIVSIFVGLALFVCHITLPLPVGKAVSSMAGCIGPMSMLVIGTLLAETDLKAAFSSWRAYWVIVLRLLVFPVVMIGLLLCVMALWNHPESHKILLVALLCAIGPPASTITQIAQMVNNPQSHYISSVSAFCTVLCVVTMPVMCVCFQFLIGLV